MMTRASPILGYFEMDMNTICDMNMGYEYEWDMGSMNGIFPLVIEQI